MEAETPTSHQPSRTEVESMPGGVVLEFGTSWCGWCRGAQPLIHSALEEHPRVRHLKVEDGPGKALGRSFGVKLWPTLVFLRDGREMTRVTRPGSGAPISAALTLID